MLEPLIARKLRKPVLQYVAMVSIMHFSYDFLIVLLSRGHYAEATEARTNDLVVLELRANRLQRMEVSVSVRPLHGMDGMGPSRGLKNESTGCLSAGFRTHFFSENTALP